MERDHFFESLTIVRFTSHVTFSGGMSEQRTQLRAMLRAKYGEARKLRGELEVLIRQLDEGPPKELAILRKEMEDLQEEQRILAREESELPDQCRFEVCEATRGTKHLSTGPLFPPGSEGEKENGRIRILGQDERICYPTHLDKSWDCGPSPKVLARIICSAET
jgi:hypothetical protein